MKSLKCKKVFFTVLTLTAIILLFSVTAYADDYGSFKYSSHAPDETKGEDFAEYIEINGYDITDEEVGAVLVMPDNIDNVPVTTIAASAFADKDHIGEVIIPDSVTAIENAAFRNCKDLKVVIIPDSVQHIGDSAFQNCESLEYVIIGSGVKLIGDIAFKDCPSLRVVSLGSSVEVVGAGAFFGCPELKTVRIPQSVKDIESLAFGFTQNGNTEAAVEGFTFFCDTENSVVESYVAKYSASSEDTSEVAAAALTVVNNSKECAASDFVNIRVASDGYDGVDIALCSVCGAVTARTNTDIPPKESDPSGLITGLIIIVLVIIAVIFIIRYIAAAKKRRALSIAAYKEGKPLPDEEARKKEEKKIADKLAKKRAKQEASLKKYIDL